MNRKTARRVIWADLAFYALCLFASLGLHLLDVHSGRGHNGNLDQTVGGLVGIALVTIFLLFGALIASRQPNNPISWIFLIVGPLLGLNTVADAYATHAAGPLPAAPLAAWLANLTQGPSMFGIFVFLFLLFPNGRLLTSRWRPVAWVAAIALVVLTLGMAVLPGPLQNYPSIRNPIGIGTPKSVAGSIGGTVTFLALIVLLLTLAAAAVSLVLRFRRSRGEERLQLKWVASATALGAVLLLSGPLFWGTLLPPQFTQLWPVVFFLAVVPIPIAIGIAMLKYRLYEIDLIINRALVYGSLTITLAGLYLGGVIGLQALFRTVTGQSSQLAIAISTLAIAAVFNPWRHRLQAFIDRRFYRHKYDAARTLAALQSKLRDEVDVDQLSAEIVAVVQETMQPTAIALWLRDQGGAR